MALLQLFLLLLVQCGIYALTTNKCASNSCLNGGECLSFIGLSFTICKCPFGFVGVACEEKAPCADVKCEDGRCMMTGPNSTKCEPCPLGFKGQNCQETDPHPCAKSNACNTGECKDEYGYASCECKRGYRGIRCEERNSCADEHVDCENGWCTPTGLNSTRCYLCPPGLKGPECKEKNPDACKKENECNNGVCVKTDYGAHCECKNGYFGFRCEYSSEEYSMGALGK